MKLRLVYAIAIFVGSYLPLALILLVQDINYAIIKNEFCEGFSRRNFSSECRLLHPRFALVILGLCLVGFCLSLIALSAVKPKLPIRVIEAKYIPAELMSYTLPYVVAFMSIGYQEIGKIAGLVIFLMWMFWITHAAGQILLNPLLTVFGWRLYEVKYSFVGDATLRTGRALVKGQIEPEQRYSHDAIQEILFLKPVITRNER